MTISPTFNPGYHIGFAGTFYTLWYANKADQYTQKLDYCGPISTDRKVAEAKYPGVPFSNIKGTEWNVEYREKNPQDDGTSETFVFGKYKGENISNHKDTGYIKWYWAETKNLNAFQALLDSDFIFHDGTFMTKSEYDRHLAIHLLNDGTFEVTFSSNINKYREISVEIDDEMHMEVFPYGAKMQLTEDLYSKLNVIEKYYRGYSYYVIDGFRSMKGTTAKITTKDANIISIDF